MNFEEFLKPESNPEPVTAEAEEVPTPAPEELDVQKAVVEELAADKAVIEVENGDLKTQIENLKAQLTAKEAEIATLKTEILKAAAEVNTAKSELLDSATEVNNLKSELLNLKSSAKNPEILRLEAALAAEKAKDVDTQERNPNALALLDRDVELPDRFAGETRDHVLEVLKEARDAAETNGRVRRAQLLEGVLAANEPNGSLARRRAELEKLFADNQNVINGTVLAELQRLNIPHKHGETYLLPSEIINRTY